MCPHSNSQIIQEEMTEEYWEEGDVYSQRVFDWVLCPDCGEDFACYHK